MDLGYLLYEDNLPLYDNPADFYWHTYNAELMFLLFSIGIGFEVLYRHNCKLIYTNIAKAFGILGIVTFLAIMVIDAIQDRSIGVMMLTFAVLATITFKNWLFSKP